MADPVLMIDKAPRLSEDEIDALLATIDPGYLAAWPTCTICGRPKVLLGVPYEPVTMIHRRPSGSHQTYCRVCYRTRRNRADRRAEASEAADA